MKTKIDINELIQYSKNKTWQEIIEYMAKQFSNIAFSTSFSAEDQLITQYIAIAKLPIKIFTLDTGRLPNDTYEVWQKTTDKYNINIAPYYPHSETIENFVKESGINSFYNSATLRHQCCQIRKLEPLRRALVNQDIWISGITKAQSSLRATKEAFEYDENFGLIKYYPLLSVEEKDIWNETKKNNIPYNNLYDNGYTSIGCQPCTRAIKEGEDSRAGRWWWESDSKKECGLHLSKEEGK